MTDKKIHDKIANMHIINDDSIKLFELITVDNFIQAYSAARSMYEMRTFKLSKSTKVDILHELYCKIVDISVQSDYSKPLIQISAIIVSSVKSIHLYENIDFIVWYTSIISEYANFDNIQEAEFAAKYNEAKQLLDKLHYYAGEPQTFNTPQLVNDALTYEVAYSTLSKLQKHIDNDKTNQS